MTARHQLAITTSQCGDHTGQSWQMTCHIEHIIYNPEQARKSNAGATQRKDRGVADADAIRRLKMQQPQLLSLSKHSPKGSGVGGVGVVSGVMTTGLNSTGWKLGSSSVHAGLPQLRGVIGGWRG